MNPESLIAALQLADSGLPIGRFVHSHGLEAWARADRPGEAELLDWIASAVTLSVAPLDGVAIVSAHRARTLDELLAVDRWLTARKLTPNSRKASAACGRQLAALSLPAPDQHLSAFRDAISARETPGNLAVVFGATAAAHGIPEHTAVLVELRGHASGLVSSAVRLGLVAPARGQALLFELTPELARAAEQALELDPDDAHSGAPLIDLFSLKHPRLEHRLFSS